MVDSRGISESFSFLLGEKNWRLVTLIGWLFRGEPPKVFGNSIRYPSFLRDIDGIGGEIECFRTNGEFGKIQSGILFHDYFRRLNLTQSEIEWFLDEKTA